MKCKFYVNFGLNERLEVLKKKKGTWDEYLSGLPGRSCQAVLEHTWFLWVEKAEILEFLYYIDFFDERKMYLLLKSTKRGGNNYPRHTICIGGGSYFFPDK